LVAWFGAWSPVMAPTTEGRRKEKEGDGQGQARLF